MTGGTEQTMSAASTGAARRVRRPATTFRVRRRGLSPKRQAEFEAWIDRYGIDRDGPLLDWEEVFGRSAPIVLDIGFGHGESTISMARAEPGVDVVGVEVHTPGVVTLLDAVVHEPLPHVRAVHADLLPFLDRVGVASLHGIRIYFPDPWVKARQHHRRLVRTDIVAALVDRLRPGGFLHLATDVADYGAYMREVADSEPRLTGGPIPRPPWRPVTRFERRGVDAGRAVVDLWYQRVGDVSHDQEAHTAQS